jgi:hypothetical protein
MIWRGLLRPFQLANAHASLYFSAPASTTPSAATAAKAAGTTTLQRGVEFTMSANNRLLFSGAARHVHVLATLGVTKAGGGATLASAYVAKSGSVEAGSKMTVTLQNTADRQVMSTAWTMLVDTGDYIEVFLESDTGDDITVQTGVLTVVE